MRIRPAKRLSGRISVPGDKSISHRAAILASMAEGKTRIENFSTAKDCHTTIECLRQIGARIEKINGSIVVHGVGKRGFSPPNGPLDCGNSGTTARLLAGLLAGQGFDSILTGDRSLSSRTMQRIIDPLSQTGALVEGSDGHLPLHIKGSHLHGIEFESPVASAQVKSCLLIAGLLADGSTSVTEPAPTRDHTERMLRWFGVDVACNGNQLEVSGDANLKARDINVPGDISSAVFFMAAAAALPGSEIALENVGLNPTRTPAIDVLRSMGAGIRIMNLDENSGEPRGPIAVKGGLSSNDSQQTFSLRGNAIPAIIDELPVLAVLGTQIEAGLEVRDAGELRHKESDRISAVVQNLRRMGACVEEFPDGFKVERSVLQGAHVDSFGDHRIAMAFAVAGLLAMGETQIDGTDCVDISFPGFFEQLDKRAER